MKRRRRNGFIPSILGALCALGILAPGASAAAFLQVGELACKAGNPCNGATTFEPQSIAVDESTGDVYVSDGEHNLVDRFHSDGSYDSQIANAAFEFPAFAPGIAVDGSGNLYIGGKGGNAYAYDPAGSVLWEKPGAIDHRIRDIALDPSGGLWVLDRADEELVELDVADGEETGTTIDMDVDPLYTPCAFAFRATGTIAAGGCEASVGEYAANGEFLRDLQADEPGAWAYDVAVDTDTDSLLAPVGGPIEGSPKLREWNASGDPVASVALPTEYGTGDLAVDSSHNRIYLVDGEHRKVLVYAPTAPLTVNVTGAGQVESDPVGISCQADESCTGEFVGAVALTPSPAPGYIFAGWLGCKRTGDGTCVVTVEGATEVTAVFLKEGVVGPVGPQGGTGPTGGTGASGNSGATGPQGPRGERGPGAKVTCKVRGAKKPKVTCTVRQPATATASAGPLHWRLTHAGRTVRRGAAGGGRIHLGALPRGHYRLEVQGGERPTAIVVD